MKRISRYALWAALALMLLLSASALAEAPGPVENLRVTALGDSWAELAWDVPAGAGDQAIIYRVRTAQNESAEADDSVSRTHRVEGLTPGQPQAISVFADTAAGEGADATVTVIPGVAAAPSLRVTAGNGSLQYAWDVPATMAGESVTRYEADSGSGEWEDIGLRTSLYYSNLENDVPFTLKVRAYIGQRDAYGPEAELTGMPYVPADPPASVAIEPGMERIDLTWEAPASDGGHPVTHYALSLDSGVTWPYKTEDADTTAYAMENLVDGELYGLAVAAVTEAGIGLSYEAWVIPPAPLAPENLAAVPGDGEVTLSWTPPQSHGVTSITTYDVCVDPTLWVLVDDVQSYVFSGIENGTNYTFYVRARNSLGTGPYAVVNATPVGAPNAPSGLSTAEADGGGVTLRWSAPGNDGGSPITGYEVALDGAGWTDVGENTQYTFSSAATDSPHTLSVRARNAQGTGEEARAQFTPVVGSEVPSEPSGLTLYPRDGSVRLTWSAPSSDGGNPILYYELSVDGGQWSNLGLANAETVSGLTNGTTYTFYVRAVTAVGAGPYAQGITTPGPMIGRPGEPLNPRIAEYGDGFITVAWDPPSDSSPATSYEVSFQLDSGWINIGDQTSYQFTGLVNNMTYTVYIRAINDQGTSAAVYVRGNPTGDYYSPSTGGNDNIIGPGY